MAALITVKEAAAWACLTPKEVRAAGDSGEFKIFPIAGGRISEEEFGLVFGLEVPGPRTQEVEMEMAEARAKKAERHEPRGVRVGVDHWLYWFYDAAGRLLYIGITNSGVKRMEQHGADKLWWPEVAQIKVDHFPTREAAEEAERAAIKAHRPAYNGTHNLKFKQQLVSVAPDFDDLCPIGTS